MSDDISLVKAGTLYQIAIAYRGIPVSAISAFHYESYARKGVKQYFCCPGIDLQLSRNLCCR
jgi:hypothetical protein